MNLLRKRFLERERERSIFLPASAMPPKKEKKKRNVRELEF